MDNKEKINIKELIKLANCLQLKLLVNILNEFEKEFYVNNEYEYKVINEYIKRYIKINNKNEIREFINEQLNKSIKFYFNRLF